jgi:hypothetical protein
MRGGCGGWGRAKQWKVAIKVCAHVYVQSAVCGQAARISVFNELTSAANFKPHVMKFMAGLEDMCPSIDYVKSIGPLSVMQI